MPDPLSDQDRLAILPLEPGVNEIFAVTRELKAQLVALARAS